MTDDAKDTAATIIPTLRYRDAVAAIDWLCQAFGFRKHLVVPGDDGGMAHAPRLRTLRVAARGRARSLRGWNTNPINQIGG